MPIKIDVIIPIKAQAIERMLDTTMVFLKLLTKNLAQSVGKIIKAVISSDPTKYIERTMVNDVIIDIKKFILSTFIPLDKAKSSSNVTK